MLWRFQGTDGAYPKTSLALVNGGLGTILFGATSFDTVGGGGTVFELTP